jgi:hypothetical protein
MKERRAFPRYPITFPVKVGIDGPEKKHTFNAQCVEISRSSIQISCDSAMVEALLAQDNYPHMADLDFSIPNGSIFSVFSQVVTHRRLAQNQYYLVMVFNEFHKGSDEQLAEYLKDFEFGGLRVDSA